MIAYPPALLDQAVELREGRYETRDAALQGARDLGHSPRIAHSPYGSDTVILGDGKAAPILFRLFLGHGAWTWTPTSTIPSTRA